jgi:hypothetical protein
MEKPMRKPLAYAFPSYDTYEDRPMCCSPNILVALLVSQWKKLTRQDIEATEYRKRRLAQLIEQKYGIDSLLAENYLTNIERTLPLAV